MNPSPTWLISTVIDGRTFAASHILQNSASLNAARKVSTPHFTGFTSGPNRRVTADLHPSLLRHALGLVAEEPERKSTCCVCFWSGGPQRLTIRGRSEFQLTISAFTLNCCQWAQFKSAATGWTKPELSKHQQLKAAWSSIRQRLSLWTGLASGSKGQEQ